MQKTAKQIAEGTTSSAWHGGWIQDSRADFLPKLAFGVV